MTNFWPISDSKYPNKQKKKQFGIFLTVRSLGKLNNKQANFCLYISRSRMFIVKIFNWGLSRGGNYARASWLRNIMANIWTKDSKDRK